MMHDPRRADADPAHLHVLFAPIVAAIFGALIDRGLKPLIVETFRSAERQQYMRRNGFSRVPVSKHEHTELDETGVEQPAALAVDICDAVHGWNNDAFFEVLQEVATQHGCTSGNRWHWRDAAHVEVDLAKLRATDPG